MGAMRRPDFLEMQTLLKTYQEPKKIHTKIQIQRNWVEVSLISQRGSQGLSPDPNKTKQKKQKNTAFPPAEGGRKGTGSHGAELLGELAFRRHGEPSTGE